MKAKRTWVLVADSARARVIRDLATSTDAGDRLEDLVFESDHKRLREIMSDRPGRSFASLGARRSAMEYHSNPVREHEKEFAVKLTNELAERHAAGEFDRLAVVAEPRLLGLIRQNVPASMRELIVVEVAKDLTKLPASKLRDAILELGIKGLRAAR